VLEEANPLIPSVENLQCFASVGMLESVGVVVVPPSVIVDPDPKSVPVLFPLVNPLDFEEVIERCDLGESHAVVIIRRAIRVINFFINFSTFSSRFAYWFISLFGVLFQIV
jgi:hypothetical protein